LPKVATSAAQAAPLGASTTAVNSSIQANRSASTSRKVAKATQVQASLRKEMLPPAPLFDGSVGGAVPGGGEREAAGSGSAAARPVRASPSSRAALRFDSTPGLCSATERRAARSGPPPLDVDRL